MSESPEYQWSCWPSIDVKDGGIDAIYLPWFEFRNGWTSERWYLGLQKNTTVWLELRYIGRFLSFSFFFFYWFLRRFNCVGLDSPAWAMWRFRARVKGRSKSSISLGSWHSIKLGTAKAVASFCSQRVSCSQPSVFRLPASGCQRLFDLVDKETGSRTISWLLVLLVPAWAYTSPSAIEMTCSSPEGTVSQMGLPCEHNETSVMTW